MTYYVMITTLISIGAVFYLFRRIFHPQKCSTCGDFFWTIPGMHRHFANPHRWTLE